MTKQVPTVATQYLVLPILPRNENNVFFQVMGLNTLRA
jgi:hypothetical protein